MIMLICQRCKDCNSVLCTVALFVFFAAAAGAEVVATDSGGDGLAGGRFGGGFGGRTVAALVFWALYGIAFGLADSPGDIVGVGAHIFGLLTLRLRALEGECEFVAQQLEQSIDGIVLDGHFKVIEHTEGFVLKLDKWIALPDRAEANASAHHIEGVDVVHPETIHHLEQVGTLKFALRIEFLYALFLGLLAQVLAARLIVVNDEFGQIAFDVFTTNGVNILRHQILRHMHPDLQDLKERFELPLLGHHIPRNMSVDQASHLAADHIQDALMHIATFKNGPAVGVNDLALFGDHIVILDDMFTHVKVIALHLGLCAFNEARDEPAFQWHILFHADLFHNTGHTIGGEAAHQLVIQSQEEAGSAGIALTSSTTA